MTVINQERLRAEKKKRRRAKHRSQPEANPLLNVSTGSAQSSTDFNILEERQPRNTLLQRTTAVDYDQLPPVSQKTGRTFSASSVTFSDHIPVGHQNGHVVSEEDVRPASATPAQTAVFRGAESPKTRSFSSSNIHRETYHGGYHDTSLPPVRGTRVTSTLPRMVKSVSHHGGSWKTASIDYRDSYNLGFVPLGARQPSTAEIEYIRKSQIFNIMKSKDYIFTSYHYLIFYHMITST